MKQVLTILCLLLVATSGRLANAQQPWIELAPTGEYFHISMPDHPRSEPVEAIYGDLRVKGTWYTAGSEGASYAIWTLVNINNREDPDSNRYLDAAAELFWQALLKPAQEGVRDRARLSAIAYVKELSPNPLPGREYSVTLGALSGTAQVYVAEQRIFVLLAANTSSGPWERERFLSSFKVLPEVSAMRAYGDPRSRIFDEDDGPIFTIKEVDQRARLLEKPEPTYSESARMFQVQGTVVLRAVFSRSGKVTRIVVVKRLPHAMTERCVTAARAIKFSPAIKDGKPVSTWMQLEYNFNLF